MTVSRPSTNPKGKPRTQRQFLGDESRRKILDAAMTLFSRQGYEGTSIAQLSKASGLPSSSIYWHFDSKEGVFWGVAEQASAEFFGRRFASEDSGGDALERLRHMFEETAHTLGESEAVIRLQLLLKLTAIGRGKAGREAAQRVRKHILELWQKPLREIFAPDGNPEGLALADNLAEAMRAFGLGAFVESQKGASTTDKEYYLSLLDMFWDLIRARAAEFEKQRTNQRRRREKSG